MFGNLNLTFMETESARALLRIPFVILFVVAMVLAVLGGFWLWLLYVGAIEDWFQPHISTFLSLWVGGAVGLFTSPGVLIFPALFYLIEGHLPWHYLHVYVASIACVLLGVFSKALSDWIAEQESRSSHGELPTRWLRFYIILLWVKVAVAGTAALLALAVMRHRAMPWLMVSAFEGAAIAPISAFVAHGLWRRKLVAWRWNWVALAFDCIPHVPASQAGIPRGFNAALVFTAVALWSFFWFLPNYVYFKRRKVLFGGATDDRHLNSE